MMPTLERLKKDLDRLLVLGEEMSLDLIVNHVPRPASTLSKENKAQLDKIRGSFEKNYQRWYTEASAFLAQVLPTRLSEFRSYYHADVKRKTVDILSYSIQDWLTGMRASDDPFGKKRFEDGAIVSMRFQTQTQILNSAAARFESALLEIRQLVQADLFDSELHTAAELLKRGFSRASGAVAGVVLERHLRQVCDSHNVAVRKKQPTIGDLNDLLKSDGAIEIPAWRFIQRLADLRNLADHNRDREPAKEEMQELCDGVDRVTKTVA